MFLIENILKSEVEDLLEWFTEQEADTEACLKYLFTFRSVFRQMFKPQFSSIFVYEGTLYVGVCTMYTVHLVFTLTLSF